MAKTEKGCTWVGTWVEFERLSTQRSTSKPPTGIGICHRSSNVRACP